MGTRGQLLLSWMAALLLSLLMIVQEDMIIVGVAGGNVLARRPQRISTRKMIGAEQLQLYQEAEAKLEAHEKLHEKQLLDQQLEQEQEQAEPEQPYRAPPKFRGSRLQYYVHVAVGGAGLNPNLLPPLNPNKTGQFGRGELFNFNATLTPDATSPLVAHVQGFTIDTSYQLNPGPHRTLLEVEQCAYNYGRYNGTLQIQGFIRFVKGVTNEVAIIGGTGSFRGARGYGFINSILYNGTTHVAHHDIRFL